MVTDDGKELSPKDAIPRFVDNAGKLGPSAEERDPDGEGEYGSRHMLVRGCRVRPKSFEVPPDHL